VCWVLFHPARHRRPRLRPGRWRLRPPQLARGRNPSCFGEGEVVQTPPCKAKSLGDKLEKLGLDSSPSRKSARAQHIWSKEDVLKILEALAGHVKRVGVLPKTDVILAAVHDHLDRKNCTHTDMYEKIRGLKKWFKKLVRTGVMPSGEDELWIYNLLDATWGEKAKEAIAAAATQNELTVTKGKKGQSKRHKGDGNSKGGTLMEATNDT
jgi:hypothetical protein